MSGPNRPASHDVVSSKPTSPPAARARNRGMRWEDFRPNDQDDWFDPVDPTTVPRPLAQIRCAKAGGRHLIGVVDEEFVYFFGTSPVRLEGPRPHPEDGYQPLDVSCPKCTRILDPFWEVDFAKLAKVLAEKLNAEDRRPVKIRIVEIADRQPFSESRFII